MRIKDVEIITTNGLERRCRSRRLHRPAFLKDESAYDWKPKEYSKLYSDSFEKYKLFCNFLGRGEVALLNQRAEDILNLCNGERKIKDIFENLSLKKIKEFSPSKAWHLGKEGISFKKVYNKLRFGEEILTLDDLVRIFFIFSRVGLIYAPELPQSVKKRELPQPENPLDVYFHLTDKFSLDYPDSQENLKEITKEEGFRAIDSIFDSAQKNNYNSIFIRFFVVNSAEFSLLKELIAYIKRKSIENFIEAKFSLFTNWALIDSSFIKDIRQMRMSLVLPLDGIGKIYNKQAEFLKRKGDFKEVEKALNILEKEKYSPFIITTITSLNLDNFLELTSYLLDRKLYFAFNFIQKNPSVPLNLFPDKEKLIKTLLEAYKIIKKRLPPYAIFQNILGRSFPLFAEYKKDPSNLLLVYQKENLEIKKINLEVKQKNECSTCQFREFCLKSYPLITSHFSFQLDSFTDYCEVYKKLIPKALKLEAKRLIQYKK